MKPGLRVSAVIVNHESAGIILETVRALTEQTYSLESIFVIDNHSQDGDPQRIQAAFPQVNLITLPENAGLSGRAIPVCAKPRPNWSCCSMTISIWLRKLWSGW